MKTVVCAKGSGSRALDPLARLRKISKIGGRTPDRVNCEGTRRSITSVATIVVSGAIANKYLKAGEAWHRLQWVLGLKRLGHTVFFVEQIAKENCLDAEGAATEFETCVNLQSLR